MCEPACRSGLVDARPHRGAGAGPADPAAPAAPYPRPGAPYPERQRAHLNRPSQPRPAGAPFYLPVSTRQATMLCVSHLELPVAMHLPGPDGYQPFDLEEALARRLERYLRLARPAPDARARGALGNPPGPPDELQRDGEGVSRAGRLRAHAAPLLQCPRPRVGPSHPPLLTVPPACRKGVGPVHRELYTCDGLPQNPCSLWEQCLQNVRKCISMKTPSLGDNFRQPLGARAVRDAKDCEETRRRCPKALDFRRPTSLPSTPYWPGVRS